MASRGEVNAKDLPSVNLNGVIDSTYSTLLVDNATNEGHTVSLRNFSDAVRAMVTSDIMASIGGEPKIATSMSDMTDTERIYVLTTDSNWYYYDGSAWTAGGTYGAVATDTTLTEPMSPADAKKVGDEFDSIKSSLSDMQDISYEEHITDVTNGLQWEQGLINSSGGRSGNSKRIRTWDNPLLVQGGDTVRINVPSGFKIQGYLWVADNSGTFITMMFPDAMQPGLLNYPISSTSIVRFMMAKEDHNQTMSVAELPSGFTVSIVHTESLRESSENGINTIDSFLSGDPVDIASSLVWSQGLMHTNSGLEIPIDSNWTKRIYTPAYYEVSPYYDAVLNIYVPETHKLQIYEYQHDGTYEKYFWSTMQTGNLKANITKGYKYRFMLALIDHTQPISTSDYPESMAMTLKSVGGRIADLYTDAANKRVYNLPIPSDFWSSPVIGTYSTDFPTPSSTSFTSAMYHAKLQALFDVAGRNTVSGYTELGQDSAGNSLYKYVINYPPMRYASSEMAYISDDALYQKKPKIVMITGIHGFERPSTLGFYYFVKNIFESTDPIYEFIRNHVNIVAVPLMCPSGWNGATYDNGNGRNLNRDFPGTQEGTAWSEIESNLLKGVIEDNLDMDFFLDWHNCYYRTTYPACISYGLTDDPDMYNPYLRVIQTIGNRWQKAYPAIDQTLGTLWGHNAHPNKGTVGLWLTNEYGIKNILFESGMRHQVLGGYSNTSTSDQQTDHGDEYCVRQGVEIATNLIIALMRMISV